MKINFYQKGLSLSDRQREYIEKKIQALSKFKMMKDESVLVKVEVELIDAREDERKINLKVNINFLGELIRAEERGLTVEEAIDLVEDKLKTQLEKYKEKHE
jgi:ribosomal subunit interface protein